MIVTLPLLLLSSVLPAVQAASDSELLEIYAKEGLCYHYIEGHNDEKALAPCKTWCEEQGSTSYGVCYIPSAPFARVSMTNKFVRLVHEPSKRP